MLEKTTGLVLHIIKYSDSSNIVDIYTSSQGRISCLVPVSRSKKSPVKPTLFQPLTFLEFEADLRPKNLMYRIREVKAFPFRSIPYDPFKAAIALFLSEFLYRTIREEGENAPLFAYLKHSLEWFDECRSDFANFHLVFLMRLSRFLGLYPNLENYRKGDYFDLLNASFTPSPPIMHRHYVNPEESYNLIRLMRMNYDTMHIFAMNRTQRNRCLLVMQDYYMLHIPGFQSVKSLSVLQELFEE